MESLAYPYAVLAFRNNHPQNAADAQDSDRPAATEIEAPQNATTKPASPRTTREVVVSLPL